MPFCGGFIQFRWIALPRGGVLQIHPKSTCASRSSFGLQSVWMCSLPATWCLTAIMPPCHVYLYSSVRMSVWLILCLLFHCLLAGMVAFCICLLACLCVWLGWAVYSCVRVSVRLFACLCLLACVLFVCFPLLNWLFVGLPARLLSCVTLSFICLFACLRACLFVVRTPRPCPAFFKVLHV